VLLKSLKWTQLVVAIATTAALALGLLLPGAMGILAATFGLLYVVWSVRTMSNGRLSIWLAGLSTLSVALVLSGAASGM
jgi:hypothetical protein